MKYFPGIIMFFVAILAAAGCGTNTPSGPGPTATITPTNTLNGTLTVTPTRTVTPSRTRTATRTATRTGTPTRTTTFTITRTHTASPTRTMTPTRTNTPIALYSVAAEDGYVRSDGNFLAGGDQVSVGDTGTNVTTQALISFDLTSVSQPVTSAVLYVYQRNYNGDAYGSLGPMYIAHLGPNYAPLDGTDYADPAGVSYICPLITSAIDGWYSLSITSDVEGDRAGGKTRSQFRLYFLTATDNDNTFDSAGIQMPEYSGGIYSPRLEIKY